jgi:catechol 2,3-dioxygenase-like lactoylglutathione lyase family enzyme
MITGAHTILYSSAAEEIRAFFRDVLEFPSVDAGGGWLIFAMPPAELAVHPTDGPDKHELYLMCDDIEATMAELDAKGVPSAPVSDQGWGLLTTITLPGGSQLGLYQPRHPIPTAGSANPGTTEPRPAPPA